MVTDPAPYTDFIRAMSEPAQDLALPPASVRAPDPERMTRRRRRVRDRDPRVSRHPRLTVDIRPGRAEKKEEGQRAGRTGGAVNQTIRKDAPMELTVGRDGTANAQGDGARHRAVHRTDRRPQPAALRRGARRGQPLRRDHRPGRRDHRPVERGRRRGPARAGHRLPPRRVGLRAPVRPGDEITAEVEVLEVREDKPIASAAYHDHEPDGTREALAISAATSSSRHGNGRRQARRVRARRERAPARPPLELVDEVERDFRSGDEALRSPQSTRRP